MGQKLTLIKNDHVSLEIDHYLNVFALTYQNKVYFLKLNFKDNLNKNLKPFFENQRNGFLVCDLLGKLAFTFSETKKIGKTILVASAKVKPLAFSFIFTLSSNELIIETKVVSTKLIYYGLAFEIEANHKPQINEIKDSKQTLNKIIFDDCEVELTSTFDNSKIQGNKIILKKEQDQYQKHFLRKWTIRPRRLGYNYNTIKISF